MGRSRKYATLQDLYIEKNRRRRQQRYAAKGKNKNELCTGICAVAVTGFSVAKNMIPQENVGAVDGQHRPCVSSANFCYEKFIGFNDREGGVMNQSILLDKISANDQHRCNQQVAEMSLVDEISQSMLFDIPVSAKRSDDDLQYTLHNVAVDSSLAEVTTLPNRGRDQGQSLQDEGAESRDKQQYQNIDLANPAFDVLTDVCCSQSGNVITSFVPSMVDGMTKKGKRQKLTENALDRSGFYQSTDGSFHDLSHDDSVPTSETLPSTSTSFQGNRKRNRQKKKQKDPLDAIATEPSLLTATPNCQYCNTKCFYLEPPGFCCASGEIQLVATEMPRELMLLYLDDSEDAKEFRRCVRRYNNVFAFTSIGVHIDQSLGKTYNGIYTFQIQG